LTHVEPAATPLPGQPAYPSADQPAVRAALALRRVGHAISGRILDDSHLAELADVLEELAERAEQGPHFDKHTEMLTNSRLGHWLETGEWPSVPDGDAILFDARSFVGGPLSAMGMGAHYWRVGNEAHGRVTVGRAYEGPPGRVHGGAVAAIFDEIMGALLPALGVMAFTGRLSVRYRRPTPLGVPLELRSWLASREGRRLHLEAEATADGVVFATAQAIFVEQDPSVLLGAGAAGADGAENGGGTPQPGQDP
jgi:acyl-coenzyme A thioesterase PaaI-like protein